MLRKIVQIEEDYSASWVVCHLKCGHQYSITKEALAITENNYSAYYFSGSLPCDICRNKATVNTIINKNMVLYKSLKVSLKKDNGCNCMYQPSDPISIHLDSCPAHDLLTCVVCSKHKGG